MRNLILFLILTTWYSNGFAQSKSNCPLPIKSSLISYGFKTGFEYKLSMDQIALWTKYAIDNPYTYVFYEKNGYWVLLKDCKIPTLAIAEFFFKNDLKFAYSYDGGKTKPIKLMLSKVHVKENKKWKVD